MMLDQHLFDLGSIPFYFLPFLFSFISIFLLCVGDNGDGSLPDSQESTDSEEPFASDVQAGK